MIESKGKLALHVLNFILTPNQQISQDHFSFFTPHFQPFHPMEAMLSINMTFSFFSFLFCF